MSSLLFIVVLVYVIITVAKGITAKVKPFPLWLRIVNYIAVLAIWFYAVYPAINIHSVDFWIFVAIALVLGILSFFPPSEKQAVVIEKDNSNLVHVHMPRGKIGPVQLILYIIGGAAVIYVLFALIFSPIIMAGSYAKRIKVTEVPFSEIPAYHYDQTAIIDRSSASLLGDKVMGQMTDLVSQFSVSSEYNQISYKESTSRVTPLAYDGFIKYLRNRKEGVPGYILVNTTTGNTELIRLDKKMRYVPSAFFNENIYRYLRFKYLTVLFGDPTFEIDDEGNPWYVCTTYTYTGIHSMHKVTGVILFDPVTGDSTRYAVEDAPKWVDRIYPEALINEELNDYGRYQKGWINSWLGQEGVTQTSSGYNYLSKNGDIWLYTGMTSAVSDESNVGFMLVNMRTHEAQFTPTSGATEYAVMKSAEGEVLNYGYTATFPTLINVGGEPVYLLSLKDSAGLIKMYAMVDARDYQQVYTTKAEKNTAAAISELIRTVGGTSASEPTDVTADLEITIDTLREAVIGGNTFLYIKSGEDLYKLTLSEDNAGKALFLKEGDKVTVSYVEDEETKERVIYDLK
ncbi:MAG: hypothetical protein IJL53_05480 [Firmicutes bacterium]|nr:hypothetical protein [Bacillota bacterium]